MMSENLFEICTKPSFVFGKTVRAGQGEGVAKEGAEGGGGPYITDSLQNLFAFRASLLYLLTSQF